MYEQYLKLCEEKGLEPLSRDGDWIHHYNRIRQ